MTPEEKKIYDRERRQIWYQANKERIAAKYIAVSNGLEVSKDNPMCCIYAQQALDGTTYTGKTASGYKQRIRRHNSDLEKGKHCNKNLQAYYTTNGKDAVKSFVQEVCSKEDLHEKERAWIAYYREQGKSFNILSGGTKDSEFKQLSNCKAKTWQLLDRNNKIITFVNYYSWCSQNGVSHSIHRVLTGKQPHCQGWRNISELGKTYMLLNPEGNLIVVDNVVKFAEENGLDTSKVYQLIRFNIYEHKGYKNPQHLPPTNNRKPRVRLTPEERLEKTRANANAYYASHKAERLAYAKEYAKTKNLHDQRKKDPKYIEYRKEYNARKRAATAGIGG